jgi:hypothetical protein
MARVVAEAMAVSPFAFEDVFIYSHGWSTDPMQMMDEYNRFSVEFVSRTLTFQGASPGFPNPPRDALSVGIHWPSEITEDPNSPLNALQLLTFYTMEHRADVVGRNAVYSMLRLILASRVAANLPLRIFMLGHSFGCKVVCAALQDMQTDVAGGTIVVPPNTQFRVVLLEPATDCDNLEATDIYGSVSEIANLRILMTKSQCDTALTKWYVDAGRVTNLFDPKRALGDAGPTQDTITAFNGADAFSVDPSLTSSTMFQYSQNLIVADLTAMHTSRASQGLYSGGLSGSHSDINFDQVYYMVSGFLYG